MDYNAIKLAVFDLDGSITDGFYGVMSNGVIMKSFYTRDIYAMNELKKHDIRVLILTQSLGQCMQVKLDSLLDSCKANIELATRVNDKKYFLDDYLEFHKLKWKEISYFGDAQNDWQPMHCSGITGCPSDAIESIIHESNFISDYTGGKGAVYDFVMNCLLKNRG